MTDYSFSDYKIYGDASTTVSTLNKAISTGQETLTGLKSALNESIFLGPAADSCREGFGKVETRMNTMTTNFKEIDGFIQKASNDYKTSDEQAKETVEDKTTEKQEVTGNTTLDPKTIVDNANQASKDAVSNMVKMGTDIANDSKFGYSTGGYGELTGNTFDCGGLMWYLLNNCYDLKYDTTQGISPYMLSNQLPKYGFEKESVSTPVSQDQLQVGDILVNPSIDSGHAAMYIGDGKILEARWNYDSQAGDSSGNEISINSYNDRINNSGNYNFNYTEIIHTQNRNLNQET